MYGGTLNGNFGPLLDDLLSLTVDRVNGCLTAKMAAEPADGRDATADPGPRRGHSMTATTLANGEPVACVLGGWSDGEVLMTAHLLHKDADSIFRWQAPALSGTLPEGRAFHTATEVAPSRLVVYGGLGTGCCRTDVALLDLRTMAWSAPRLEGAPRCVGGRAGHGAAFFPCLGSGSRGGGELLLLSGAMRSSRGDTHQMSIDAIEVEVVAEAAVTDGIASSGRSGMMEWAEGEGEGTNAGAAVRACVCVGAATRRGARCSSRPCGPRSTRPSLVPSSHGQACLSGTG